MALTGADKVNKRSVAEQGESVRDCHAVVSEGDDGRREMSPHISSTRALSDDSRRKKSMSSCSDDEAADSAAVDDDDDGGDTGVVTSIALTDWQSLAITGSGEGLA